MAYRNAPFPMIVSDLHTMYLLLASLFKCNFSYSYAAVGKISTNMVHHVVPLWLLIL